MLHAELHGKLSSELDEQVERREDVLTSTVFGTLFTAGAWNVVVEWFARALHGRDAIRLGTASGDSFDYWFWPRLHNAEPDVVLQIGRALVVVEAKYNSGKSSSTSPDDADDDQLVREWHACSVNVDCSTYEPKLRALVADPTTERSLIYLIRRNKLGRARNELERSMKVERAARMYVLTWEDLDEVLATRADRWANELRQYLHRRKLAAFRGFDVMTSRAAFAWLAERGSAFEPDHGFSRIGLISAEIRLLANRPDRFSRNTP